MRRGAFAALRGAVIGVALLSGALVGDSASAATDNVKECIVRLGANPGPAFCEADQTQPAGSDADNIVKLDIVIEQAQASGTQDASIDLRISQLNEGSGENRIEGIVRIVQKMDHTSSADIVQVQNAVIDGRISSQTDSGRIVLNLDAIVEQNATGIAKGSSNDVQQAQCPAILLGIRDGVEEGFVGLLSNSGNIDANIKPTILQKLAASANGGNVEQNQSQEGTDPGQPCVEQTGIDVDVDAHTDFGLTKVITDQVEDQNADGTSQTGNVIQRQDGPNLVRMVLQSGPDDDGITTLKTTQKCNDDTDCDQDNLQLCEVGTAGEGRCTLETAQSSDNAESSQTCEMDAETGGCTIKAPDGQTFTGGPGDFVTVQCFPSEGGDGPQCFAGELS